MFKNGFFLVICVITGDSREAFLVSLLPEDQTKIDASR